MRKGEKGEDRGAQRKIRFFEKKKRRKRNLQFQGTTKEKTEEAKPITEKKEARFSWKERTSSLNP